MKGFILLVLLFPSVALASYPHGYKLTHNDQGVAYVGGYYTWDAYKCKWLWYANKAAPSYATDSHNTTISYSYQYNYNQASANAGASQQGLYHEPAFRYDQYDVGRDEIESQHYVAAARSVDERRLTNQHVRDVQAGYTRGKLVDVQKIDAAARLIKSLESSTSGQILQQFNYGAPGISDPGQPAPVTAGTTEAKCMACHATGQTANGVKLPVFSSFNPEQAGIALDYITSIRGANCSKRADLTDDEHKQLVRFFAKKSQ